jgi:hypothetical protein
MCRRCCYCFPLPDRHAVDLNVVDHNDAARGLGRSGCVLIGSFAEHNGDALDMVGWINRWHRTHWIKLQVCPARRRGGLSRGGCCDAGGAAGATANRVRHVVGCDNDELGCVGAALYARVEIKPKSSEAHPRDILDDHTGHGARRGQGARRYNEALVAWIA